MCQTMKFLFLKNFIINNWNKRNFLFYSHSIKIKSIWSIILTYWWSYIITKLEVVQRNVFFFIFKPISDHSNGKSSKFVLIVCKWEFVDVFEFPKIQLKFQHVEKPLLILRIVFYTFKSQTNFFSCQWSNTREFPFRSSFQPEISAKYIFKMLSLFSIS